MIWVFVCQCACLSLPLCIVIDYRFYRLWSFFFIFIYFFSELMSASPFWKWCLSSVAISEWQRNKIRTKNLNKKKIDKKDQPECFHSDMISQFLFLFCKLPSWLWFPFSWFARPLNTNWTYFTLSASEDVADKCDFHSKLI